MANSLEFSMFVHVRVLLLHILHDQAHHKLCSHLDPLAGQLPQSHHESGPEPMSKQAKHQAVQNTCLKNLSSKIPAIHVNSSLFYS